MSVSQNVHTLRAGEGYVFFPTLASVQPHNRVLKSKEQGAIKLDIHPQRRPENVTRVSGFLTEFPRAAVTMIFFPCVKKKKKRKKERKKTKTKTKTKKKKKKSENVSFSRSLTEVAVSDAQSVG